jgi:methylenetetrahydrofolate reductase (NADPH)
VLDTAQLPRFKELSGCVIPDSLVRFLGTGPDVLELGVEYATEQCRALLKNGVAGIHIYCLNKHQSVVRITNNLRVLGLVPRRG